MKTTTNHGSEIVLGTKDSPAVAAATACLLKNGAYCNKYGGIYLRISSMDTTQEGWPVRAVDHGISIEEAHCIAVELLNAIQLASQIKTGRANVCGEGSPRSGANSK